MATIFGFLLITAAFFGMPYLVIDGVLFQVLPFEKYHSKKRKALVIGLSLTIAFLSILWISQA